MAEGNMYSPAERRDKERGKEEEEEELYKQFEELSVSERKRKMAKCESCVRERPRSESFKVKGPRPEIFKRASQLYGRVAVFLCFVCEMYVCAKCMGKHRRHKGMKVGRKESEEKGLIARIKKRLQKAGGEREKNERKRMRRKFVVDIVNESERLREQKFFNSHAIVCDRVEVKHELDQTGCRITGLCGLENKRWVVCDSNNSCIKIFKVGSHVLQRYIRFVRSGPLDVTEIHLKWNSAEPNLVSGSSSGISAADRADQDKQCLIAVTLPWKHQIMFIDISKKPAKLQKVLKTERQCQSIQFYDDKIFTVCSSPHSVYIKSTDGDTLNKFNTDIYRYADPYLAVVSGRVYLTDRYNDKVQCRNVEGKVISEFTIEGSRPSGISVDPDNNVYVCAWGHNKVYKLDSDLTRYKSVLDQTAGYIESPRVLCCYRDKLFISHYWLPSLQNFVTVVRLL